MTTLTIRDFRSNLAASLDRVDKGEQILVRRGSKTYTIIVVDDGELEITPQLAAKIEKARQEYREGKAISLKTHEDVDRYFESM